MLELHTTGDYKFQEKAFKFFSKAKLSTNEQRFIFTNYFKDMGLHEIIRLSSDCQDGFLKPMVDLSLHKHTNNKSHFHTMLSWLPRANISRDESEEILMKLVSRYSAEILASNEFYRDIPDKSSCLENIVHDVVKEMVVPENWHKFNRYFPSLEVGKKLEEVQSENSLTITSSLLTKMELIHGHVYEKFPTLKFLGNKQIEEFMDNFIPLVKTDQTFGISNIYQLEVTSAKTVLAVESDSLENINKLPLLLEKMLGVVVESAIEGEPLKELMEGHFAYHKLTVEIPEKTKATTSLKI